jgi:MFS transporter, SP family, general alpha glucoside:H+ symporter
MRSCEIAQRTRYSGDLGNTLAHMKETILLEEELSGGTTYLDSFGEGGANLRRKLTCAMADSGQFMCGINLASSYCTYLFELVGLSIDQAFDLSSDCVLETSFCSP